MNTPLEKKEGNYDFSRALKKDMELTDRVKRWISLPLTKFLILYTKFTPNHITVSSFLCTLVAGFFLLQGGYINQVWGGIFTLLREILDQMDGEMARIKGIADAWGKWFDGVAGFVSTEIIIVTLAMGMGTERALFWGMLAAIAFPLHYLLVYFYKHEVIKSSEPIEFLSGPSHGILYHLRFAYGSALFYVLVPILLFLHQPLPALQFFAIVGNLFWMGLLVVQYRNIRKIKLQQHKASNCYPERSSPALPEYKKSFNK